MTSPDMMSRPSASRILSHPFLKMVKSRSNTDLGIELRKAKEKIKSLERILTKNELLQVVEGNANETKQTGKPTELGTSSDIKSPRRLTRGIKRSLSTL